MSGTPRTRSLDKAVALLQAIGDGDPRSASALARETSIPRPTVTRTLRTLADAGFVEEHSDGWALGRELYRLAQKVDPHRRLVELSRPVLVRLRSETGESALFGIPRTPPGMEILAQLDAPTMVGVRSWLGVDVPLHASAPGKLVLAGLAPDDLDRWLEMTPRRRFTPRTVVDAYALRRELSAVRRTGVAELADELEIGLASVSVAVRDAEGSLVGMIGISGPTFRLSRDRRRAAVPAVVAAARRLGRSV